MKRLLLTYATGGQLAYYLQLSPAVVPLYGPHCSLIRWEFSAKYPLNTAQPPSQPSLR